MDRKEALLDRSECMSLLCIKASYHWSFIKFCLNIPLILTNSILCIMNSISDDKIDLKIPNVVVNSVSVLMMAINNNLKSAEKMELFKNLSNSYLLLTHEIEGHDPDAMDREKINSFQEKYDSLISQCCFEEIPIKIKQEVANKFEELNKTLPVQLNGGSIIKKRSPKTIQLSSDIGISV